MTHTPGPWKYEEDGDGYMIEGTARGNKRYIAHTSTYGTPTIKSNWDEANARLIASAPELLEACKDMLEWIDVSGLASTKSGGSGVLAYNGTEYNVVTQLRQAISKAEGRK